ncbi:MAG: SusE domain-containing protein [Bacteroidales bacterium]|nr:SusE domain-containing protein [Bacteroidales bacterium]
MKKIIFNTIVMALLIAGFTGCSDKNELNLNVKPVKTLYEPTDNKTLELQPEGSLFFEWEHTKAEDGGMVLYEVAFDKEGGDFSNPVYKIVSDNNGSYNSATITFGKLNKICALAGIEPAASGKVIWTVFASKGINAVKAEAFRTLQLTRLAGIAEIPGTLFVTGEATEGGTDLANAVKMKATESGIFEVYTRLNTGSNYFFTDVNSGTPRQFYVQNNVMIEGESTSTVEKTGVYRIVADLNTGAVNFTEITNIELFFCPDNALLFSHEYQGNGVWKASGQPITFKQESWGRDERYKFKMTTINNAGETVDEWWGTPNIDHRPGADEPESYWYLFPVDDRQWEGKYKFADEMDNALVDISIFFQSDKPYTHQIVKVGDQ